MENPREVSGVLEYGFLPYDTHYFLCHTVIESFHCNLPKFKKKIVTQNHISVVFWEIVASSVVWECQKRKTQMKMVKQNAETKKQVENTEVIKQIRKWQDQI